MKHIQRLTRYKVWADDLFLSAVSPIPAEDLNAARPIAFGSLLRTLNHAYSMDYVWHCHLLGKAHGLTTRNPEYCPSIEVLASRQRGINQWYLSYFDTITEEDLDTVVAFEFIGGGAGYMTRQDILLHVVNHATYHRGQAADILYGLNIVPPPTDLPVFLRQQSVEAC